MDESMSPPYSNQQHSDSAIEPAQEARLGPIQRLFGMLFSPGETFQDINRKPTWLAPIAIGILLSIGLVLFFEFVINPDWVEITRQQMRRSRGAQAPDERGLAIAATFTRYITLALIVVAPIVVYFLVSGLFALGLMLMQAKTTFKKILSVVAWTYCSTGLVGLVVSIASAIARGLDNIRNLPIERLFELSATNPGVFLGSNSSAVLRAVLVSIDIFSFWQIFLLTIGLTAIAGSRKFTKGKAAKLVIGLWLLWVLIKVLGALANPSQG
jgi:hypothetical protein